MKKVALVALFALLLVGVVYAQGTLNLQKVDGYKTYGSQARYGSYIWNNMANDGWFTGFTYNYLFMDWGSLPDANNGLPDEVADGFQFVYATGGNQPGGVTWIVYYFDEATGFGDVNWLQEAGFIFTGLPDAAGLPAGYWGWTVTVDLAGGGYEFLVADRTSTLVESGLGVAQVNLYVNPLTVTGGTLTLPPFIGGNGDTGTTDAFDIFYPTGGYKGAYFFGGWPLNPYGSFQNGLFGASDPALGTKSIGNGLLTGNEASIYATGSWALNGVVDITLRMNKLTQAAALAANTAFTYPLFYLPGLDVTVVPTYPFLAAPPMTYIYTGDFTKKYFPSIGGGIATLTLFLQGGISNFFASPPGPAAPMDFSRNVIRVN
jgi:hypothetical protein